MDWQEIKGERAIPRLCKTVTNECQLAFSNNHFPSEAALKIQVLYVKHQHYLEICWKSRFLGPTSDLLHQKLGEGPSHMC